MTNYEKIRAMSVEEMAAVLANEDKIVFSYCSSEHCEHYPEDDLLCSGQGENKCVAAVLHWLNSEAEDDTSSVTAHAVPPSPRGEGLTGGQKDALLRTFLGRGGSGA